MDELLHALATLGGILAFAAVASWWDNRRKAKMTPEQRKAQEEEDYEMQQW